MHEDTPKDCAATVKESLTPQGQPASVPALDKQAAFEAWLENYPIQVVGDDYELCSDAFDAGVLAAAPAPQPAQAVMAPEYAAAVRELAEQSDMSEAQVLRAAVRLYQAEQKGLVTVEHKEQIGPLAAPQPAQAAPAPEPEVWLYDFMDGATTVRNWSTTNKAEAYAPGNFNQRGYVPAEN